MALSARGDAINGTNSGSDGDHRCQESESRIVPLAKNLSPLSSSVSLSFVREHLASLPSLPSKELTYSSMQGSQRTRELIATFMSKKLLANSVSTNQVIVLDGEMSLLNALAICLCEEGDRVMVPSEIECELSFLLKHRAKVHTIAVPYIECSNSAQDMVQALEAMWESWGSEQSRIKMIYVSYPNLYVSKLNAKDDAEALILNSIIAWAISRKLHTIVNITNALSAVDDNNFIRSWNGIVVQDDVHIIWNPSKFFGIPGASLCALITRNKALLKVFALKLSYFGSTSRQSQWVIQHLLSDACFFDNFIQENQRNLLIAYKFCIEELEKLAIPYRVASTGYPILLNLLAWISEGRNDCSLGVQRLIGQCDILASYRSNKESETFFKHVFLHYASTSSEEVKLVLQNLKSLQSGVR